MVKTPHFHGRGHRFNSWWENQDPVCHEAENEKQQQKNHWPLRSEGEVFKTDAANVFYVPTRKTQSRPQTSGALHGNTGQDMQRRTNLRDGQTSCRGQRQLGRGVRYLAETQTRQVVPAALGHSGSHFQVYLAVNEWAFSSLREGLQIGESG